MITKIGKDLNPYLTPGYKSEKPLQQAYHDRFKDQLLSGDIPDGWMDQKAERPYVDNLRDYYDAMVSGDRQVMRLTKGYHDFDMDAPNQNKELRNALLKTHARESGAIGATLTLGMGGGAALQALMEHIAGGDKIQTALKPILGVAALGAGGAAAISAVSGAKKYYDYKNKPWTHTSMAMAKRRRKMSDEELLKMLRGNVVSTVKKTDQDNYIKPEG